MVPAAEPLPNCQDFATLYDPKQMFFYLFLYYLSRFQNKERLSTRDDLTIDVEDYKVKLSVVIAARKHTGTYVLKAENGSGKDEASIQINVLDVPAKPEGPLKVCNYL